MSVEGMVSPDSSSYLNELGELLSLNFGAATWMKNVSNGDIKLPSLTNMSNRKKPL